MTKTSKILLAAATIWPFFYMLLFFVFIFFSMFYIPRADSSGEGGFPDLFMIILPLHFLTMLLIMGLTIFYIVNVFRNDQVDKDKKVLWAVVLFMGNMIAMPIYWYLYIWQEEKDPQIIPSPKALENAEEYGWTGNTAAQQDGEYIPPPAPPNWRE